MSVVSCLRSPAVLLFLLVLSVLLSLAVSNSIHTQAPVTAIIPRLSSVLPLLPSSQHAATMSAVSAAHAVAPVDLSSSSPSPSSPVLFFLSSFFSSLLLIFIAELGDKTFLSTLFMSASLPSSASLFSSSSVTLILATNAAAATLAVLSAVVSSLSMSLSAAYGAPVLRAIATCVCCYFGFQMLYDTYSDNSEDASPPPSPSAEAAAASSPDSPSSSFLSSSSSSSPSSSALTSLFVNTFAVSICTELFDHSQFSFLLLTSSPSCSPVAVVLGGTVGHILCTTLAMLGGGWMQRSGLKESTVRYLGGSLFLALSLAQAVW